MQEKKHRRISPYADRMGRFVGQLRVQEGITLKKLSRGLCEYSLLNKIENGERQAGKLLMDAFFQRLGKPVDSFGRILNHTEFVKWTQRQEIISHLRAGEIEKVKELTRSYQTGKSCAPERQFFAIVEIDCYALGGMSAQKLLPLVTNALLLTQPDFGKTPVNELLLTENEGHLLLALLQLREELEDSAAVADDRRTLLHHLEQPCCERQEYAHLLVPCEEQGHVYCINQVIRSRRALLGFSQEELSDDACGLRSMSRIENEDRKVQRKNRKLLLQKVNMSGERYDCEVISEHYEDCLLGKKLDQAINIKNAEEANRLLDVLRERIPDLPSNRQYLLRKKAEIRGLEGHPDEMSVSEQRKVLEDAFHLTLPLDLEKVDSWPVGILSINEILSLMMIALCYKQEGRPDKNRTILLFIKNCLEITGTDLAYYNDIYARLVTMIS